MPLRDTADENNFCVFLLVLSNKPAALSFGLFGEQALHLCLCRCFCRARSPNVPHVSRSHAPAWECIPAFSTTYIPLPRLPRKRERCGQAFVPSRQGEGKSDLLRVHQKRKDLKNILLIFD